MIWTAPVDEAFSAVRDARPATLELTVYEPGSDRIATGLLDQDGAQITRQRRTRPLGFLTPEQLRRDRR